MPDLLTVTEAAEIAGTTRHAIQQAIRDGRLPATKPNRTYQIDSADLDRYITQRRTWKRSRRHTTPPLAPLADGGRDPMTTRLRRVLAIILDLDREPASSEMLAARYGVSTRQIKADIQLIRAAGLHVDVHPYRLSLPRVGNTDGQAET